MSDEDQAATNGHQEPPAGQVVVTITMTPDEHGHKMALSFPPNMYADDLVSICRRAALYFERVALREIIRATGGGNIGRLLS